MKTREKISMKLATMVAVIARNVARKSVNSACVVYYYEPKQPKELEQLKNPH